MTAKAYLQQVSKIESLIKNKMLEAQRWKDSATSITAATDHIRVQASGSQQKMADAVANYIDIEAEIKSDIRRLINKRNEIIHVLEQLKTSEYDVLYKLYVQGMTLQEIADYADRSYRWAVNIHHKGLISVQNILDDSKLKTERTI